MSSEKSPESVFAISEKHPAEDESKSFNERVAAIRNDKTLSQDQKRCALLGISDRDWVQNSKPALFIAALSLDKAEVKAAAVEEALRAGADELDHDFGKLRNQGRVLAYFVNYKLHYEINGSLEGIVNNLPSIEIMLRHGADPRLDAPFIGPKSALLQVQSAKDRDVAPEFYEAAGAMLEKAAAELDGE